METNSLNHKVFSSPKFNLNYCLPCPVKVVATFKDLVLCLDLNNHKQYYICNPLTKQWVALPLTPSPHDSELSWGALLCEDPYYNDYESRIDYRFRVVVVYPIPKGYHIKGDDPFKIFNLIVFCSEDFQWKNIDLKVPLPPRACTYDSYDAPFLGLLCKGMVCLRYASYFGMFNPFDVTPNSSGILDARIVPLPYLGKALLECEGRLILILDSSFYPICDSDGDKDMCKDRDRKRSIPEFDSNSLLYCPRANDRKQSAPEFDSNSLLHYPRTNERKRRAISLTNVELKVLKENNNEVGCRLSKIFIVYFGEGSNSRWCSSRVIGMHPSNKCLLYLVTGEDECDMGSKCLKSLGTLLPSFLESSCCPTPKLELQYWPIPVPTVL